LVKAKTFYAQAKLKSSGAVQQVEFFVEGNRTYVPDPPSAVRLIASGKESVSSMESAS
jgi:hypothetical protein